MESIEIPKEDDVLELIEYFKSELIIYATGGSSNISDSEYARIRKILIGIPNINDLVPEFVKKYRSKLEFWGFIKEEYSSYAERRTYLAKVFNAMVDRLEESNFLLIPQYERNQLIGEGGFGQVYKVENELIKMSFAIKVLNPAFANGGEGNLERFFREARILFKLHHPNIIKVYDVGLTGKIPFIKMEHFEGKDLNKVLKDHSNLTPEKALVLIEEVSEALNYAHNEVGIVHRDIRPSNIMVARPNQFRLIDFGLGVFLEKELVSRITRSGENIVGGHYTAPELLENPSLLDPRSDIYSLGAVWFTVLTGRPPAGSRIKDQLLSIPRLKGEYSDMILKCLDDLEDRYQNINELLNDIQNYRKNILD
ncbi:serine/threonine-protein kinase [Psychrobacillus sp. FSL K6-2684]|jgi:serine/threonine-protein kinase|uniref:Serine/threonine protein kinase n=1 Tax=Psychrobacillus faecigallinarum TaxID=2762235 RepID=A0ABR8RDI6_9BACI|nr:MULTISPECIES: serine/threonine-protein kinase [Psychrobacillus]MBD7945823.1 serine/threonine protein kinase [Psychrobacillus faecigallinarum]QEY22446.1 serine/threonine protein kinase [Psychrobacillus sp. AK 1817]